MKKPKFFCDLSKHQRKVKFKTIGLVHKYIILANCSKTLSMINLKWVPVSTKCPPVHGTMWEIYKVFVTLQKGQEKIKVKISSPMHKFIILANCWRFNVKWFLANCWNHYRRLNVKQSNELWCPQSTVTPFKFAAIKVYGFEIMTYSQPFNFAVSYPNYFTVSYNVHKCCVFLYKLK